MKNTHRLTIKFRSRDYAERYAEEFGGKVYKAAHGEATVVRDAAIPGADEMERYEIRRAIEKDAHGYGVGASVSNITFEPLPEVGMKATYAIGSDCYPYEIVAIKGQSITVRRLEATPAEGYDYYSNQVFEFSSDPDAPTETVKFSRKSGRWGRFSLGRAENYRDPSF